MVARIGQKKAGFTLVELLVVISIIATLIALILPAVQKTRAAARKTQCRNNIKQLGIALHNYHEMHEAFPPGTVESAARGTAPHEPSWGWSVFLLPHLEQGSLYRQLDPGHRTLADVIRNDLHLVQSTLPIFRCPADIGYDLNRNRRMMNQLVATSNYVASSPWGNVTTVVDPGPFGFINRGIFTGDSRVRFADISDGTSNTIALGERKTRRGHDASTWAGSYFRSYFRRPNATQETDYATTFVHMQSGDPNYSNTACPGLPRWAFSSEHDGGCLFLMIDGNVRLISENIHSSNALNHLDESEWGTYQLLQIRDDGKDASTPF